MNMRLLSFLLFAGFVLLATLPNAVALDVSPVGSYDTSGKAYGVTLSGDYAYIADYSGGLVVVDVSPANPVRVGGYDTSGNARGVAVSGDYAYVADGTNGLVVVDVSDPANPFWAGGYNAYGNAIGVTLSGAYAYIADYSGGLVVVDVSDPADPIRVGGYNTSGYSYGVAVSGGYAYVADSINGLVVVDVSDPANPFWAGGYNISGNARDVAVAGDRAYVADFDNGLVIVDVSDPTDPAWVGGYNTSGSARGVAVSGDYAYVADDYYGLVVVDVSDPANPFKAGGYNAYGKARDVAVSGGYAYVAYDTKGLVVLGLDSDHDGIRDSLDAFPNDPDEQFDTDGDGVGDNSDYFPAIPFLKTWWGTGLTTIVTVVAGGSFLISRTNKGILAEAETILEELKDKGVDITPAQSLVDEAQNFSWEFGNFYFGVWDLVGKPRAERARKGAVEFSSEHSKIQEEINVVNKMLKGFDKDGVDVSFHMTQMELTQTALSEGKFTEASGRLGNSRDTAFILKEKYMESMEKIDQVKAKIAEFKEKGVNTDKLERVLAECEAEMGAATESEK